MSTLFHCAPMLLQPGSIVLPGNWGRILGVIGQSHPCWDREMALENVRRASYPDRPSRLQSCFGAPTEEIAREYRNLMAAKGRSFAQVLYEVEKTDNAAPEHRADYNVVQPLPGVPYDMTQIAHHYWAATFWTSIAERPGLRCEEVVTSSPFRILRRID